VSLDKIPQQLQAETRWVVWKAEKRNGKWTKVPYSVTGEFAKSNEPSTWTTFAQAAKAAEPLNDKGYDGVGFMLQGSEFTGIDFDGVVDDGVPEPYVLNIIYQIGNPYCEVTPSGTGLRVFIKGSTLPPGNRKFSAKKKGVEKYGAEIYAGSEGGRYLTVSGERYSGDGVPQIENIDVVYFLISKFADEHFKNLWMGDASEYENDDSRVDLALLGLLARAFSGDVPKMLRFFNASVPGHREKWTSREDYREMTLAKATSGMSMSTTAWDKFVDQPRKIIEFRDVPTEEQKSKWTAFDYVVQASDGQFDGWFPLGSPSLLGGSSGSGKTTLMLDLCVKQALKAQFYGHDTYGRPYLVLMLDRGKDSHTRTMRRLGFATDQVPIQFLKAAVDGEASQQIIDAIEKTTPTPEVVFIEGIDMLVSDPNALEVVMPFMHEMQQIATHFHIALIGSCGAPKSKPKEGYAAKRDTIFGSAVWSRMSETIVTVQYPEGDDTADKRVISILPRNAKAEQFTTEFVEGKLAVVVASEVPEQTEMKLTQTQIAENTRREIEEAVEKILQSGPRKADDVHGQLKEIYGITSPKRVAEVSADMVQRGTLKKRNAGGKWLWELSPMHATLADMQDEPHSEVKIG